MMDLIHRIEEIRERRGLKQADMARRFGVPSQNYNNWVYRGSLPKEHYEVALRLIEEMSTAGLFMVGETEPEPYTSVRQDVPLISWVSAGSWCEASDPYEAGDAEEWLPCPTKHSKSTYALRVVGESMVNTIPGQPTYPPGTIIYVDPEKRPETGDRVIAKTPGSEEVTFKVLARDAGVTYLKPLNAQYPTLNAPEGTKICGVVIGSYRPE